ncbi:MAG: 4Fe-4S single cluster domain-containing protein [Methylococcales bacterium]
MYTALLQTQEMLNVAAWQAPSVVNGPGERFVLWLQGCPRRCPGCINPGFLADTLRDLVPVEQVAARILAVPDIEGVTYSGGEPFSQAAALAVLSARLQAKGLGIVSYSGYTLRELEDHPDPGIQALLARLDLLIDGPYIQARSSPLRWRGSTNQQLHFLSPRYAAYADCESESRAEVELSLDANGLAATGIWPEDLLQRLKQILEG